MLSGINLTLKIGPKEPKSAPANLINSLQTVEVINRDDGPDGFTLSFSVGRTGVADLNHYPLVKDQLIAPFNRVIIMVSLESISYVLLDGAITFLEFIPSSDPGKSILKVTGEDISVLMDRKDKSVPHHQQSDMDIAKNIIKTYENLGLQASITNDSGDNDSVNMEVPSEDDIIPFQQKTDRKFLEHLAKKYNFVFYIEPTKNPGTTKAHWGPLDLSGRSMQKTLTFNMGPFTNVVQPLNFQHSPLRPTLFRGSIQDRRTNEIISINTDKGKVKPLAEKESWEGTNFKNYARVKQFRNKGSLTAQESMTNAQAETDKSMYSISASGELETLRYGDILRARKLVNIRGVGLDYDGTYYVKKVTHLIKRGDYRQNFEIKREGLGARR